MGGGTFSEAWYRVARLRLRLRAGVKARRQHFRGQLWYVVQDPVNHAFLRLHRSAYRFVGLLDGRRSVAEAWAACCRQLGDEAPTQGEAIAVLGQLYAANLLRADLPVDAEALFQRYRRRRSRELRARAANFLFIRLPLFDPDRLLDVLARPGRLLFSRPALAAWAVLVAAGAYLVAGSRAELLGLARGLTDRQYLLAHLPLLYAVFVLAKLVHETAHGLACKVLGRREGGGHVHAVGVVLLVFAPMPYVDASGAWALRSKVSRIIVGAAGMMAELALAAVAALVWTWTADAVGPWQQQLHVAAGATILIAGIATLVFNANPLLRFDGYYILSDLLEIPNLSPRSMEYLKYLVKRLLWGMGDLDNPARAAGEAAWLAGYGLAALAFRTFVLVEILLLLTDRFFLLGAALAAAAAVGWLLMPLGRLVHYLLASPQLLRHRGRAVATTLLPVAAVIAAAGLVKAPDDWYVQGTCWPRRLAYVYAGTDGFVRSVLPSGRAVAAGANGPALLAETNRDLEVQLLGLLQERRIVQARRRLARMRGRKDASYLAMVQILDRQLEAIDRQAALLRGDLDRLKVRPPISGTWLSRRADRLAGGYLRRGERVGLVAGMDDLIVRAEVPARLAAMLLAEGAAVEMRPAGRADVVLGGSWRLLPACPPEPPADAPCPPGSHPPAAGALDARAGSL
ncbi:MAG: hypothetical protein J7M21_03915, partial [Planctomycetes bacterium]|nr:hypothetical protein [Planctomycetota bacterium]